MFQQYIVKAGVLWMMPIILLSFLAVAFSLERFWFWACQFLKVREDKERLERFFRPPFDYAKALATCQEATDPVLQVLHKFLVDYKNVALPIAERRTKAVAEEVLSESRRFLDILSFIANLSGTLGLMGTVVGISLSFESLAMDDPKGMAFSLATAMYTTIGGILLFLLTYFCVFVFNKFADNLELRLETAIESLRDILEIEHKSKLVFQDEKLIIENGEPQQVIANSEQRQTAANTVQEETSKESDSVKSLSNNKECSGK